MARSAFGKLESLLKVGQSLPVAPLARLGDRHLLHDGYRRFRVPFLSCKGDSSLRFRQAFGCAGVPPHEGGGLPREERGEQRATEQFGSSLEGDQGLQRFVMVAATDETGRELKNGLRPVGIFRADSPEGFAKVSRGRPKSLGLLCLLRCDSAIPDDGGIVPGPEQVKADQFRPGLLTHPEQNPRGCQVDLSLASLIELGVENLLKSSVTEDDSSRSL